MAEFKEKFIVFIDILGFKSLIERAHVGDEVTLDQIREITALLDFPAERKALEKEGPLICPFSPRIEKIWISKLAEFQIV